MVMDSLIGVAGGLLSGGLNAISSAHSARRAFKYSLDLQKRQEAFSERMANTAHMREVRDLRYAGLNPILSATGGSGAVTPSAGSATVSPVTPDLSSVVSSALDYKRYKNESKQTESNIDLNNRLADKAIYEADAAHYSSAKLREETKLLQDFGPYIQQAQLDQIINNIKNANAVTAAQVRNINSSTNLNNSHINVNNALSKFHSAQTVKTQKENENILKTRGPRINAGKYGSYGVAW